MIPVNNEYYSGTGKCTIKNGIKVIQGAVTCIKPNMYNHVEFLHSSSLSFATSTNIIHLSYEPTNNSIITIKCEYNGIYAAFGTAGKNYNFTCVAI
jgi:hypothetical protein